MMSLCQCSSLLVDMGVADIDTNLQMLSLVVPLLHSIVDNRRMGLVRLSLSLEQATPHVFICFLLFVWSFTPVYYYENVCDWVGEKRICLILQQFEMTDDGIDL